MLTSPLIKKPSPTSPHHHPTFYVTSPPTSPSDKKRYVCIRTYRYTYVHTCTHLHTRQKLWLCIPVSPTSPGEIHIRIYIYIYICLCTYMYTYIHTCTYVHTCQTLLFARFLLTSPTISSQKCESFRWDGSEYQCLPHHLRLKKNVNLCTRYLPTSPTNS